MEIYRMLVGAREILPFVGYIVSRFDKCLVSLLKPGLLDKLEGLPSVNLQWTRCYQFRRRNYTASDGDPFVVIMGASSQLKT